MSFGNFGMMGILITLGSLGFTAAILLLAGFAVYRTFGAARATAQLAATGMPAQAVIVAVRDLGGSIRMGGQLPQQRLQIDLEVQPPNGAPYRTSATQLVSTLHFARLQPGATVQVRYDPSNPMRVAVAI